MKSQHFPYGYGSIPINTIFSGMNIHLPAILMFTRGTIGFDTLPNICFHIFEAMLWRRSPWWSRRTLLLRELHWLNPNSSDGSQWVTLQELITTAEAGTHMYFLVSGTLVYSRDDDELLGMDRTMDHLRSSWYWWHSALGDQTSPTRHTIGKDIKDDIQLL